MPKAKAAKINAKNTRGPASMSFKGGAKTSGELRVEKHINKKWAWSFKTFDGFSKGVYSSLSNGFFDSYKEAREDFENIGGK